MLSKSQIESIRINIRNRGVETIDLEIEMLDHISSAVEELMEEGENFREAYKTVMLSFGPNGMYHLQQNKYDALIKKGWKRIAKKYLELLTPPKVFASLCISAILYFLFLKFPAAIAFKSIGIAVLSFFFLSITYLKIKNFKKTYSQIKSYDQILSFSYAALYIPYLNIMLEPEKFGPIGKTLLIILPALYFYSYLKVMISLYYELENNYRDYTIAG